MAGKMLVDNKTNRALRQTVIRRYAQDMADGNWRVGGSTIDFDSEGHLLNGQHRLHACVLADMEFTTVVARDVPVGSQLTMDVGFRRQLCDVLTWRGEVNTVTLASCINVGWRWQRGLMLANNTVPTFDQGLQWLDRNPNIREYVRGCKGSELGIPGSVLATFVHQVSLISYEDALGFRQSLLDGSGLLEGDPILALRNWILNQVINRSRVGRKPDQVMYLALLIKTWNMWISGRKVQNLVWRRGGTQKETFPTLIDDSGLNWQVKDELLTADMPKDELKGKTQRTRGRV
jgi:hypothetical protein